MAEKPEDLIVTDAELRRQLPELVKELKIEGAEADVTTVSLVSALQFSPEAMPANSRGLTALPKDRVTAVVLVQAGAGAYPVTFGSNVQLVSNGNTLKTGVGAETWATVCHSGGTWWVTYGPKSMGAQGGSSGDVTGDSTAPTWSATLTLGTPTQTAVVVTASALAQDNVGVQGYQVSFNNGGTWQPIAPSGNSFTLLGSEGGSYYQTRLRAVDAAGNKSGALSVPPYTLASVPLDTTTWTVLGDMVADGSGLVPGPGDGGIAWRNRAATSGAFTITLSGEASNVGTSYVIAQVVFRFIDANNYCYVSFQSGQTASIYKVVASSHTKVASGTTTLASSTLFRDFKVSVNGNDVAAYLPGATTPEVTASVPEHAAAEKWGVRKGGALKPTSTPWTAVIA